MKELIFIKNLPKIEIKSFDIESINDNNDNIINNNINDNNINNNNNIDNSNNDISKTKNKNPYIKEPPKNQMINQTSNLIDTNNLQNNEMNTPINNINKRVYVIPDSFNEKRNNNLNQLINNNNTKTPGGKYNLEEASNNEDSKIKENDNNNKIKNTNEDIKNEKDNINIKNGIEIDGDNQNNIGDNYIDDKSSKIHDEGEEEIEMNKDNLEDILSIPELSEKNENNQKNSLLKKESIENQNLINQNIKDGEVKEENNQNEKEINQDKENKIEENNKSSNKNFKLDVEEIEEFEPEKKDNNENNILKHINNNEKNQLNKSEESEERIEKKESEKLKDETEKQKEEKENLENESQKNKQDNKIKENTQIEEDQYDKQYKEIEKNFNKIVSVVSGNEQPETNPENKIVQEKEKSEENNNNDSENRESEEKNKLNEKIIKKEEDEEKLSDFVEIESMKNVPKEEKKSKEDQNRDSKKEKESDSVEIELMNNETKGENKNKEDKRIEMKKEKEEKKEEDEIEIQDDSISEQQEVKDKSNKNSEKLKEKNKESKNENINANSNNKKINNLSNISKNIEEDLCHSSSRNKQSVLNKLNTMPQIKADDQSIKKSIKKSLTQKCDILIQIKPINLTEKDESSPEISNMDEIQVLNNINTEEKSLDQIIPDFNENILKNEKDDIEVRKDSLIKKKHIPLKINDGQVYSQFFGEIEVPHSELMKNNYNEEQLKSLLKYNSNFKDNIFNKLPFDEINSPIGQVESFNSFCQKYCLIKEDPKIQGIKNNLNSNFSKWRKILGDGNSFYRIIMFSIIEAYILNKNIDELKYLLFDIVSQENIVIYEQKEIDVEICCLIFAEILFLLENDDNVKAYEIFTKAYSIKDGSFDKLLIIYIRHILAIYTENVKEILPETEKNNVINSNIFNSYMIESYNLEPSFLNICCIQYLFDIKMNLVYLQGDLNDPEQRSINLVGEEEDCPYIIIGFFYNSYHKLYPENFEVTYNYDLPLQMTANKQLTCILKEIKPCEVCKTNTEHILFLEKRYVICKLCLEYVLTKIFNFRADAFQKNGFLGVEYYTRPINVGDSYYIDDYEIIELLEANILEILTQKYSGSMCANCYKKEENTIELKCGCEFCKKCLIEKVLKITNEVKVLNEFEKKQLKGAKCSCGKIFDIEEGLKYITKNSEDKTEALIRLKKYINTLCLICAKELRKEGKKDDDFIDIDGKIEYKKIKMKKSNGKNPEAEIYESDHFICNECYKQFMKKKIDLKEESDYEDEESETKNDFVDFEKSLISCSICCRKHLFRITQNENCCAGDCIIY